MCIGKVLFIYLFIFDSRCFYADGNDSGGREIWKRERQHNCRSKTLTEQRGMGSSSHVEVLALGRRTQFVRVSGEKVRIVSTNAGRQTDMVAGSRKVLS